MRRVVVYFLTIAFCVTSIFGFTPITKSSVAQAAYTPSASNRVKYCLDYDWKFIKQDVAGAQNTTFADTAWQDVSLPHTYNDVDHYDTWVTGSGDYGFAGKTWYRKHFKLDSSYTGRKVFVEFEGIRQAAEFYINGTFVGRHENGVGPCGIDISNYVNFGASENVLAVKVDNSLGYKEVATGTGFEWDTPPFNPMYGGIVKDVYLHISDKVYQTLPLYSNLGTSGTYVYATNIDPSAKTADVTVQSEVANDNSSSQTVSFEAVVVDKNGNSVMTKTSGPQTIGAGQKYTFSVAGSMTNISLWSPDYPYLYKVYTTLKINGVAVDVYETPLGIRKASFNVTDGLKLNDRPIYLKGFAPRSTMEWATVGMPPSWLEEYDFKLMKDCNANFIRPMHVAPRKVDVEAADKFGIIYACPAGDGESDVTGRQWDQRVEVMRDVTIYFRNNPSVLFYEAGNQTVTVDHMNQMKSVRDTWDPYGGRYCGDRTPAADTKSLCEYWSSMDVPADSNTVPVWDAEYSRAECPRRVWDKYSPPSYGYANIAAPGNTIVEYPESDFKMNSSEDLALINAKKYNDRWIKRGDQGLSSVMVGGAKIIFADSISHGRMADTEVARVSGALDGARLPKETYYAMQVVQNTQPEVHILGHWTYPAGTVKKVYVMSNCEQVKLVTYDSNGSVVHDYGYGTQANNFEFSFDNVAWQAGKITAIGYNGGVQAAQHEIVSAGAPSKIKVTPIVGPQGFRADGSDIAMFDVEVVDANGVRCPTDEARVDFTYSGQGKFLGGYNSGIENSIFKDYLNTECGINRVFVRSNRTAGSFTLTASRSGLTSGSATVNSTAITVTDGLSIVEPQVYTVALGTEPPPPATPTPTPTGGTAAPTPTPTPTPSPNTNSVMTDFAYTGTQGSDLIPPMSDAHVVHNAQAGMQVYVDSSAAFPTLPSYLAGGDYIQAFMRDAGDNYSTDLYQFFTDKYCYIYQLIDSANQMPTHNNNASYGWTKLPDTITINGRSHDIYKSRLMAPGENGYFASNGYGITLAPGSNLYVVFAVSAERELQNPSQTVTTSSFETANPAGNAIDGNTSTRWASAVGTFPQWITIDLGQKYKIGGYETTWYNNATRSYKYKIELSDDDVNYAVSIDKQANTAMGISYDRTNSINAREGRYVKVTVTGTSAGWASINEFKVFGVDYAQMPTPTPTPTPAGTPTPTPTPTPTGSATPTPTPTPTSAGTATPTPTPTPTATPGPTSTPGGTVTTWYLFNTSVSGVSPAGQVMQTSKGGTTGWQPTTAVTATAKYWYTDTAFSGTYNAGNWSFVLWTNNPASASSVSVELYKVNSDGSGATQIGTTQTIDVSTTGGGNHSSTYTFSGLPSVVLNNQRLMVKIVKASGLDATMCYNTNDFPTRLITP